MTFTIHRLLSSESAEEKTTLSNDKGFKTQGESSTH